jgi:hypothetical protein
LFLGAAAECIFQTRTRLCPGVCIIGGDIDLTTGFSAVLREKTTKYSLRRRVSESLSASMHVYGGATGVHLDVFESSLIVFSKANACSN